MQAAQELGWAAAPPKKGTPGSGAAQLVFHGAAPPFQAAKVFNAEELASLRGSEPRSFSMPPPGTLSRLSPELGSAHRVTTHTEKVESLSLPSVSCIRFWKHLGASDERQAA